MSKLIIIGAGGHCRAVIAILRDNGWKDPEAIFDVVATSTTKKSGEIIMGLPVFNIIKDLENLVSNRDYSVLLAIGDNSTREDWFNRAKGLGCMLPNLISTMAVVNSTAELGEGVIVCPQAFIGPEVIIGDNVLINTSAIVEHESQIGSHSHVSPGSVIAGRVTLGESVMIGSNATVISNICISDHTVVGAGGVVIKNITDAGSTWVGVPVRKVNVK